MKTPETKPTPRPLGGTYGAGEALRMRQKRLARKNKLPKTCSECGLLFGKHRLTCSHYTSQNGNAPKKNDFKCSHGTPAGEFCVHCEKTCSICQLPYTGWGNNAWPVNDGRCCSNCNSAVVIVARLNQIHTHAKKAKESP